MRISDWSSDVCSSDLYCGLADPAQPVRRSLRGAKHRAAGIARGLSPGGKRSAQRTKREGIGNGRSRKKVRRPAGTTHRRLYGAISSPPAPSSTATGRSRQAQRTRKPADRKSVAKGKSGSVRVDPVGGRFIKKKKKKK